jgi:hypothetical protein
MLFISPFLLGLGSQSQGLIHRTEVDRRQSDCLFSALGVHLMRLIGGNRIASSLRSFTGKGLVKTNWKD